MAVEVLEDTIRGTRFTHGTDGKTSRHVFKVLGLDRNPPTNIQYRAVLEVARQMHVQYASPHPTIPGLVCDSIDTEPVANSKTQVYVFAGFIDTSVLRVRINGNVTHDVTRFNANGGLLFTTYKPGEKPTFIGKKDQDGVYPQVVEVPRLRPGLTLEYDWYDKKNLSTTRNPRNGSINARLWNGGQPFTWLCTDFSVEYSRISGRDNIYHHHAGFEYRGYIPPIGAGTSKGIVDLTKPQPGVRDTHNVMLLYRNPQTRQIPPEVDPAAGGYPTKKEGNGWKEEIIYPIFDFRELKLPNVID